MDARVVDSIEATNQNQWDNVLEQAGMGCLFESYDWLRAHETVFEHTPRHIVVEKGGNPVGLLKGFVTDIEKIPFRRYDSSAFGFGGPVVLTDESTVIEEIFRTIEDICGGRILAHRMKPPSLDHVRYGRMLHQRNYQPVVRNCRFLVDLSQDWTDIVDGMDRSRRRNMRKADETDYTVEELSLTDSNLEQLLSKYDAAMDRAGADGVRREFVHELAATVPEGLRLSAVYADGEHVGSLLHLVDTYRDAVQYFVAGISPDDFEHYPAEILHRNAMQWAIENGYSTYDFGGTAADWTDGVFKFKSEFGGRIYPSIQWEKGASSVLWPLFKRGRRWYTNR